MSALCMHRRIKVGHMLVESYGGSGKVPDECSVYLYYLRALPTVRAIRSL